MNEDSSGAKERPTGTVCSSTNPKVEETNNEDALTRLKKDIFYCQNALRGGAISLVFLSSNAVSSCSCLSGNCCSQNRN